MPALKSLLTINLLLIASTFNVPAQTSYTYSEHQIFSAVLNNNGQISDSTISIEEAKQLMCVSAIQVKNGKTIGHKIKSYSMMVIEEDDISTFEANSGLITPQMKIKLNNLQSNARILFEYILVISPNLETRSLSPIQLVTH